ncbi:MAG: hypothetical protein SFU86_24990 [Pirellulaceae bacterium]|nr:hypothetical protein [Pirellulaceae bacterium]
MIGVLRSTFAAALLLVGGLLTARAEAGSPCCECAAPCVPQTVTKIVMVPQVTYKHQKFEVCVMRPETRQKEITVCRLVPETKTVSRMVTVMVPQKQTRMVTVPVCTRTEYVDVPRKVVVMVPKVVTRKGVRTVCKPVMVQVMRTEYRDEGTWDEKAVLDCHGCPRVCRVWKPNLVAHQVPVMVCKQQITQVPYECQETICVPQVKQVVERVCRPVYETVQRQITELVCVPTQVEKRFNITVCREVPEKRMVECTVLVPHMEEREVEVPVCTMVPKEVTCVVGCAPSGK